MFTLYHADVLGVADNCLYPHAIEITDKDSLVQAVCHDYVCASYKNSYRSNDNFLSSDCLPVDCDNDHSDDPEEWITPSDVAEACPGVAFAVHYSRHNGKPKNGKKARPKFHVLFKVTGQTNAEAYSNLKKQVNAYFPYFDTKALDAARFFFGTKNPKVEIFDGPMALDTFLADSDDFDQELAQGTYGSTTIPQGSRNTTMSHIAGRILKRFGDTDEAHEHFLEAARNCDPPLGEHELSVIWQSARRFFGKISQAADYIPPEQYNQELLLKPGDYSDVGQATVLSREYRKKLRYSPATDFIVYNDSFWEESKPKAQAVAQELTARQLEEAEVEIKKCTDEMVKNGAWELLASMGPKKAALAMSPAQTRSYNKYSHACAYRAFAIKRRDSKYITAALKETHPMVEIDQRDLDADEFLLNTPSYTYDLSKGISAFHEHTPDDFITKQTSVDPNTENMDVWQKALDTFFLGDITAFVLVFPPRDEEDKYVVLPYFWLPEETLDLRVRRDHVPYDVWEKQDLIETTEGNVIHYGFIEKFIENLGERYNIREIAFDRWGAVQMVQNLEGMGFTVVPFGQGFKDMSPPTKELMKLVLEKRIAHGGNPVLRWMMDNIYIRRDPAGNIKADKEKSTEKIDGAIAMIMGLDRAIRGGNDNGESVYDSRGILFL